MENNNQVYQAIANECALCLRCHKSWPSEGFSQSTILQIEHNERSYWKVMMMDERGNIETRYIHRQFIEIDKEIENDKMEELWEQWDQYAAAPRRTIESDWQPSW